MSYNETSNAYRVYIPEQKKTVVSKDVKFEDLASKKSHEPIPMTEDEEQEALKAKLGSPMTPIAMQQPSSKETVAPNFVKRPQWFT